jgi:hypothetical protein
MKKLLLFICAILATTGVCAQEGKTTPDSDRVPADPGQVPTQVTEKFNREYPGVTGSWTRDGENFRVEFTDPKTRMAHVIIYDRNGDVIRRESEVDQVPQSINEYYNKTWPGEKIRTWQADNTKGEKEYFTWRDREQVRFDREGKYIAPVRNRTVSGKEKATR